MNDLQNINKLATFTFERGSVTSAPKESATNYLAKGSENVMISGTGKTSIFKGATLRGGVSGSSVLNNVVETFAGLGQASESTAYGNVFNVFSALFYIGAGLLRLAGASLLVTASSTLSLLIKRNGVYTDPLSGAFQAGLAQPSAPVIRAITPPSGFTGKVNGVVSVVIWRVRSTTGARSVKSLVSNIVGASNQAIAVTLPLKDANGQDYWGIGVTKHTEGQVGSHFILQEIAESTVAESLTRTDVATNSASLDITSATAGFTSNHIGWQVVLSGGTPATSLTTYVTAVPAAGTLTLADMPADTSTGVSMVLTRADAGQVRTVVIEWRDGDLLNKGFAPTRDFPPPAALFGGTLEDVAFVDGAYADAVQSVSSSVRGSAIAPSEKGRPESYSPDTVVFTNDTPTALLRADGLYWRFGRNSLYAIRYVGGERPLSVELVWSGTGVEYQNNAVVGEGGRLYAWSGLPVRLGEDGMPDSSFANDIIDDFVTWTDASKIVLGYHGKKMSVVCYCYEQTIRPFFTSLGIWGSPLNLAGLITGDIKACVTENNQLIISTDDGTTDRLYDFNIGSGTIGKLMSEWKSASESVETVHSVMASVRADNIIHPVTIDVFADGDDSAPVETLEVSPARTGYQQLLPVRPNVQDCESFAIRITIRSTTANEDCGLEKVIVHGEPNSILL